MTHADPPLLAHYANVISSITPAQDAPVPTAQRIVQRGFIQYYTVIASIEPPSTMATAAPAGTIDPAPLPAADGESIVIAAWQAVNGLFSPASPPDAGMMDRLIAAQLPSGALLRATPADSPDLHWYHELILLHALGTYALHTRRPDAWAAVERSAEFHLNETQPDHATSEPWGLFAFLCFADTLPLADQLLHTVQTQQAGAVGAITWMLLRDALYCLGRHLEQIKP